MPSLFFKEVKRGIPAKLQDLLRYGSVEPIVSACSLLPFA
nr:MAG TPA: hypothetical protein [Caudoviricetes sp.]